MDKVRMMFILCGFTISLLKHDVNCATISLDSAKMNASVTVQSLLKLGTRLDKPLLRLIGKSLNDFEQELLDVLANVSTVQSQRTEELLLEMCRLHPCTDWSEWTACDASGFGGQNRSRKCGHNTKLCQTGTQQTLEYETKVCQGACPEHYSITTNNYCLKLYLLKKVREDAEKTCVTDGGHLVKINSADKQDDIETMLTRNSMKSGTLFIDGIRTVTGGDWKYSIPSGDSTFKKWLKDEPSNRTHELCKVLEYHSSQNGWYWCDRECTTPNNFICESI